jgi:hypothetical protein
MEFAAPIGPGAGYGRSSPEGEAYRLTWKLRLAPTEMGGPGALPRKEVIQPQLPLRLPCYDFAPVTPPTLGVCLLAVSATTSGVGSFHSVTGGVYKARERIHRSVLTCGY